MRDGLIMSPPKTEDVRGKSAELINANSNSIMSKRFKEILQ